MGAGLTRVDLRRELRAAESALDFMRRMRALAFPEPPPTPPAIPQLVFWSVDADGLPPRPWRIEPDDVFDCVALGCKGLSARTCVARQQATDAQRTQQASRGQGTDYPLCDSRKCAQGRAIREALEPRMAARWRGVGPGGRFAGARRGGAVR